MATIPSKKPQPATTARRATSEPSGEARGRGATSTAAEDRERTGGRVPQRTGASTGVATRSGIPTIIEDMSTVPDYARGDAGKGLENMTPEDMDQPRLKLMQGISPELDQYNDLRAGNFLHTAQEAILEGAFKAVVLAYDRRYILWRPRDMGGGILARADDGVHWDNPGATFEVKLDKKDGGHNVVWKTARTVAESGLNAWGTMNPHDPQSPPAATLMFNYLLIFPTMPDLIPAVFTFQRAMIGQGKKFNTKMRTAVGHKWALFQLVFQFNPFKDTNKSGQEFWNCEVTGAGHYDDPDTYDRYKGLYEIFATRGIKVKDMEDETGESQEGELPGNRPSY